MRFVLVSLFGGLLAASLCAQIPIKVTFRTLAESGTIGEIYYDERAGLATEIKANGYARSTFYEAPFGIPMEVYRILPPLEGESEPQREVLGLITWPNTEGPHLLLISKRGERYSFSVVPDDFDSFPFGTFRVINGSSKTVLVKAGDTMVRLASGESEVLAPDLDKEVRGVLFQVAAHVDEPRLVYSNLWSRSKTLRTLVFITDRDHHRIPFSVTRLHESEAVIQAQRPQPEGRSAQ